MNKILVIGDVHGKIMYYKEIILSTNLNTIQVGDFGFAKEWEWLNRNVDYTKHKVILGNHDDYYYLDCCHSLKNFSFLYSEKLMTIRGAESIDKNLRTEGVDWFRNEEIDYLMFQSIIDLYLEKKPKIVITHDCPQFIRENYFGIRENSRTSFALQVMFENYQPEKWIFGHHHKEFYSVESGTEFICLPELKTLEVEIE